MSRPPLTLHRLPAGHRILYTGVLGFLVLGFAAGLVQQHLRAGLTPGGVAAWWLGNADDPAAAALLFPKDAGEILDATWRREMVDVLPAIVLAALLARAALGDRTRRGLSAGVLGLAAADLAAPAAVRWGGAAFAGPALAAQLGLAALAAVGAGLCLRDLWLRPGPRLRAPDAGR